jgi:hypothetical protein
MNIKMGGLDRTMKEAVVDYFNNLKHEFKGIYKVVQI